MRIRSWPKQRKSAQTCLVAPTHFGSKARSKCKRRMKRLRKALQLLPPMVDLSGCKAPLKQSLFLHGEPSVPHKVTSNMHPTMTPPRYLSPVQGRGNHRSPTPNHRSMHPPSLHRAKTISPLCSVKILPPTSLLTVEDWGILQLPHGPVPTPLRHLPLPLLHLLAKSYKSTPSPPLLFLHVRPRVRRVQRSSSWGSSQKLRPRTRLPLPAFHQTTHFLSFCTPTVLLLVSRLVTPVVLLGIARPR